MFAKYVLLLSAAAVSHQPVEAREHVDDLMDILRDVDPASIHTIPRKHPLVGATTATCSSTVDRIKQGPANIPVEINNGVSDLNYRFTDTGYKIQDNVLSNDPYTYSTTSVSSWKLKVANGQLQWKRWRDALGSYNVFDSSNTPKPTDSIQG